MKKAKLILEDGSTYEGMSFGYERNVSGELVFSTGMSGYPESLTDLRRSVNHDDISADW